ncbi:unnamed protein product [Bursaphelenchus xylophilus]|uniref:Glutamate-rich WD repeat-containing protein 1 n=1 Tax=Bursaphelenchus xylophilus TaxID=6326 RepID=A0A1I7RSV0_BURXY|nr:unnamed protein product [Bursaphelenchus xylophilus]CAG9122794.1 unnamed protein product [Bursaphelenchus xylophilus]
MAIDNDPEEMEFEAVEPMDDDDASSEGSENNEEETGKRKVYIPGVSRQLKEGEELEYDPDAYKIFHTFETENPCLSFDVLNDNLGDKREKTPLTCYLVGGTQVEKMNQNQIIVMRLSNMYGIADEMSESEDEDEDPEDDDEEAAKKKKEKEPVLTTAIIKHQGEVNRIKSQSLGPSEVCAVWNSTGKVQIWNLNAALEKINALEDTKRMVKLENERPIFSFDGHSAEGFALDWSPLRPGALASGDQHKKIFLWSMGEGGQWSVNQRPLTGHNDSVEDIQWSNTEESLLVSVSVDKSIRLWDIRAPAAQACVCKVENAHESDINVVGWNKYDPLIVTGGDDAVVKVWSLKNIQYGQAVARFKHHKSPITSVEWHPEDSTTFMASGEDNQITFWDLAMETDTGADEDLDGIPPQLLFVHMGLEEIKEVHWHPKINGLALATALNGFHAFRTINI